MSPQQSFLYEKAKSFCDYQERCIYEVKSKLLQWRASEDSIEKIIQQLESEDYINEERYAIAFANGKLRNNKWGKNKIFYALTKKHVPEIYIQMALNEIDEKEYIDTLKSVISSKNINEPDEYKRKAKMVNFCKQKGFQASLVFKILNEEL
ncbi:MAG: RecX family transcriptional regulator [Marinilabiliales bacterium]|nr:MAG: RecX family transcriptional regulator [Marinilabiliales bacterium]